MYTLPLLRRASTALAALVSTFLATFPAVALPDRGSMRILLVQSKVDLADSVSYQTFQDHLLQLVRSQVKPKLAADRPNLIVFPEDVGLAAAFIGSRGAISRSQATSFSALNSLFEGYYPAVTSYADMFGPLPAANPLNLALTDTLWRAFYPLMRRIARETGSWVVACTNVSGDVRSVNYKYGQAFSDPDLPPGPVYVAHSPDVYNTAFVFSPSGDVVTAVKKSYLVLDEENLLTFTHGPLVDVRAVNIAAARVGIVISKDAWMPDVLDRLAILGTDTLIQPEAFEWTVPDNDLHPEDWLPDDLTQSGWMAVHKYSGFRYSAVPFMTGNFFDLPWDGQSAVIQRGMPNTFSWGFVGQDPRGGFLTVAPWVIPDPGRANPLLALQARREMLRNLGIILSPYGTDPSLRNRYVETIVTADLNPVAGFPVVPAGKPGALGSSSEVAATRSGEQTFPSVASDGGNRVAVTWQDTRDGYPQVYAAISTNGGKTFGPAVPVSPSHNPQRTPSVVVTPHWIVVAWQEGVRGERQIRVASSMANAMHFGTSVRMPTPSPADEWKPALAWDGAKTRGGNGAMIYLAFVGTRGAVERVQVARASTADWRWTIAPADTSRQPADVPANRNNQWAPSIAACNGEVTVAWVDFRSYSWDVYAARSSDGGRTFAPPQRVDDAPNGWFRHHADPVVTYVSPGRPTYGWSDVRMRQAFASARVAPSPGATSVPLASGAAPGTCSWLPRVALLRSGDIAGVWQDLRTMGSDVYTAVSHDGGATFARELRVDDGGDGASYQFNPQIAAMNGGHVVVVWEDTRSGVRRIRTVEGSPYPTR